MLFAACIALVCSAQTPPKCKDVLQKPSWVPLPKRSASGEIDPSASLKSDRLVHPLTSERPVSSIASSEQVLTFDPSKSAHAAEGFTKVPVGYTGTILVENPANLKAARAAGPRALVAIKRSKHPEASLLQLRERPEMLTVVDDFPRTIEHASNIHGRTISSLQLDEIQAAQRQLEKTLSGASPRVKHTDLALLTKGPESICDRVKQVLATNRKGDLVVLIGHIERGNIRFHDKSELPIADLPREGQIWILGCRTVWNKLDGEGLDLATGRAIRYADAAAAVSVITRDVDKGVDYHSIAIDLQNMETQPSVPLPRTNENMLPHAEANEIPVEPIESEPPGKPAGFAVMVADNGLIIAPMNEATA